MRHSWDYGRAGSYSATSRSCRKCGATGRRFGKGSTPWTGRLPDGRAYDSAAGCMPACPGTPWVRNTDETGVFWSYGGRAGIDGDRFAIVTSAFFAQFGRQHVEDMLRRNGHPPLPEEAWADLEVPGGNPVP